jgi:transposase InsO family protein
MGQLLHGSARITAAVRRAIQHSQASLKVLSRRYGIHPKTVAKWKKRTHVTDASMGPKQPHSTVLTKAQEAPIVAFLRHTLLPLDDCLYAWQVTIPHLTRSALNRCLQRHGINHLPDIEGDKPAKQTFEPYPIGDFHLDIAEVRTEEGKLCLFVAIDRTCKFAYAELHEEANKMIAAQFLRNLIAAVPYTIHTVLADNGIQFTNRQGDQYAFRHIFDRVCHEHGIEHRLTQVNHPWTNGQVERMNRTLKQVTVQKYYYQTHQHLKDHLQTFLIAYTFAKRLKTLRGLTPYEYICQCWQQEPDRFTINPCHHTLGLNTPSISAKVVRSDSWGATIACRLSRRASLESDLRALIA